MQTPTSAYGDMLRDLCGGDCALLALLAVVLVAAASGPICPVLSRAADQDRRAVPAGGPTDVAAWLAAQCSSQLGRTSS